MYTPLCGAIISLVYPRWYLDVAQRSSAGRPITFSDGYPEPIVSPVGGPLYVVHRALRVSEPTCESEPVAVYNWFPTGPTRRFHSWLLRGRATLISPDVLLSSLYCTPP